MPQMAPISWLILYFLFFIVFLFLIIINFYSFFYTPKISKPMKLNKKLNWKW